MYSRIVKNPRPLGALLAAGLLYAGAACSRSHTVTTADGGKVSYLEKGKDSGSVTVTGSDGKTATLNFNQNKVPDDYPKDVPIYTPSKVVMSQTLSEKNARNLMLESTATKEQRQVVLQITDSNGKRHILQVASDKT